MNSKDRKELANEVYSIYSDVKFSAEMIPTIMARLQCIELLIKRNDMSVYRELAESDNSTYDELLERLKEEQNSSKETEGGRK